MLSMPDDIGGHLMHDVLKKAVAYIFEWSIGDK
jgi:hypothetical protein